MQKPLIPIVIGTGFLVSASLIAGLASADMDGKYKGYKGAKVAAKRLDTNKDGMISIDELTARQQHRFGKLDRNNDGMIDTTEFNARIVAMFNRMDTDANGLLDDDEISKMMKRDGGHQKGGFEKHEKAS